MGGSSHQAGDPSWLLKPELEGSVQDPGAGASYHPLSVSHATCQTLAISVRPQLPMLSCLSHSLFCSKRPNLLAQSKNGSGKTGAFGLAMLQVCDSTIPKPQAVCISPTRELAVQTTKRLQLLGEFLRTRSDGLPPLTFATVIGGVQYNEPVTSHVLVATPGKTVELIRRKLLDLSSVKLLSVDEADDMILNFKGDMENIKKACTMRRPSGYPPLQVLLFSASFDCIQPSHPASTGARDFVESILDRKAGREVATVIVNSMEELRLDNVTHFVVRAKPNSAPGVRPSAKEVFAAKLQALLTLYEALVVGKAIVFASSRDCVDELAKALRDAGHKPTVARGGRDMKMDERSSVIDEFEKGITKVLIATDLLGRGVDIPDLKLVINFELPRVYDEAAKKFAGPNFAGFQHRCGRVGRFGAIGVCLHIVGTEDEERLLAEVSNNGMGSSQSVSFPPV
jgi:ATP-dependent RNA helicase DDX19/DBP5